MKAITDDDDEYCTNREQLSFFLPQASFFPSLALKFIVLKIDTTWEKNSFENK